MNVMSVVEHKMDIGQFAVFAPKEFSWAVSIHSILTRSKAIACGGLVKLRVVKIFSLSFL
jgi:hypothetical protein